MKALKLMAVFALVAGIFCGGGEQPAEPAEQAATAPAEGGMFAPLTEAEMAGFTKALPGVAKAIEAAQYKSEQLEGEDMEAALVRTVAGMKSVAGVDEALAAAGTNWDAFSGSMHKVMAATAAIGIEMAAAMAEGMDTESEEAQEMAAQLEKAKEFAAKVPQENKDMVIKHMDELDAMEAIE